MVNPEPQVEESSGHPSALQAAFKRLKVDPEWNSKLVNNHSDSDTLQRIWAGNRLSGKVKSHSGNNNNRTSTKRQITGKCGSSGKGHRVEPYCPLDCIDTMQHLSFKTEVCRKASCGCSKTKGSKVNHQSPAFTYTSGPSPVKWRIIWEEKLKIRNSEKDRKQIIRSAKLRLYREGKVFQARPIFPFGNLFKSGRFSEASSSPERPVFGSGADNSTNFHSLSLETDSLSSPIQKDINNSSVSFSFVSDSKPLFSGYFSSGASKRSGIEQTSTTDSCSHTSVKRPRPSSRELKTERKSNKTCSLEARISKEDFSVNELASYFEDYVYIPKKMSSMAEMMYT